MSRQRVHRRRRKRANALQETGDERRLLDRILAIPQVARVVPRLQPEVLHRVIQTTGLEDCGDLVAMATPAQLQRVFDLDLWRAGRPGRDEQLDADRFAVWLEVLMERGANVAAPTILATDVNLMVAALAQHMLVFDRAAVSPFESADGDEPIERRDLRQSVGCEIGNYVVEAKRTEAWDTIVALLLYLDAEHPDYFHRVMRGCRSLSNSNREIDGLHDLLDDSEQHIFDVTIDRDERREHQGYVTPAEARAFLSSARHLQLGADAGPPPSPLARAHLHAIDPTPAADGAASYGSTHLAAASESPHAPPDAARAMAAVIDVLVQARVLAQQPRALLDGLHDDMPRFSQIRAHMQFARDLDDVAYAMRMQEFAYLANTLIAGCSVQARSFTEREATDATLATCNLGLENWPHRWLSEQPGCRSSAAQSGMVLAQDFLVHHDLVGVFQVGWTVLHDNVCVYATERLIDVLDDLRCDDRHIQISVDALRRDLAREWRAGAPWRVRDAFDVIAILDMPTWATLLGLIDECPVVHAGMSASPGSGIRAVSASAFDFISENRQIASIRQFLCALKQTLRA